MSHPDKIIKDMQAIKRLIARTPHMVAGAAEKMKDANFSAQGFVNKGKANKWKGRDKETRTSGGKRVLHSTGLLQQSVKTNVRGRVTSIGVDLGKVPYAKAHNEGGNIIQHVKPHHRKDYRSGKRYQVRGFARKIRMPKRQFIGHSPDIFKIVSRELTEEFTNILKQE